MICFVLSDQIPSGKNALLVTRQGRHVPSRRFTEWRRQAAKEVLTQVTGTGKPLIGPCHLQVYYTPVDQRQRDVTGMLDALFHLFEYCGLIEHDGQIETLSWWRLPGKAGTRIILHPRL